jgi:hypothetical protein
MAAVLRGLITYFFAANDEDELTPPWTVTMISAAYVLWLWPRRLAWDTRGVVLVLVALLLPVMVGLTGLGVETGLWYAIKRQNQAAADEAAISGAMEVAAGKPDWAAQALCTARQNGFDSAVALPPCPNALAGATVNKPPTSGTYSGNNSYVEVILSQQQSALFANFNPINLASVTIKTRAVAGPNSSSPVCVLALHTSGTDVTVAGNGDADLTGCSVDTNSNSASSVALNGNNSQLTAYTINTSGQVSQGNGTLTLTTAATTNAAATPDPYAGAVHAMPAPCAPGTSSTPPPTPSPGCYTSISITSNVVLAAGVYYINGGSFSVTGHVVVTGTGVTIVLFNSATVNIAGQANVTLSAPTSGAWQGVLFWQDAASSPCCTTDSVAGNGSINLTGALYFPHGNVSFTGNSGSNCTVLIANTVTFAGNGFMSASACAADGVTTPSNPSGPVALVE